MDQTTPPPGLKYRPRKNGPSVAYWIASPAAVKAGYTPKSVRLTADTKDAIRSRCERLQHEMLMWISGPRRRQRPFSGTFKSLLDLYVSDPQSSYRALKYSSQRPYDFYIGRLRNHIGDRRIDKIDARDIARWFDVWAAPNEPGEKPKLAGARMAICVLKAALKFGKGCRYPGCAVLKSILDDMRFTSLRPRQIAPTAEQTIALRQAAHAGGAPLRALAYAIQFETTLRQWDVIGQWVPLNDPRSSTLLGYGEKWIGPTWARIDDGLILRVTPTKTEDSTEARVSFDLNECPMVLEELAAIQADKRKGPLIINESTTLPYRHDTFREAFREDRRAAGLSPHLWNRDLRAGGVTEGGIAGASIEDRQKVAGHAAPKITAEVYDRDTLESHRRVARARTKLRGER